MRKFALVGVLAVLALALSATAGAQRGPAGVKYAALGPDGILSFANATGRSFEAFNAHGLLVQAGVIPGPYHEVPAPNVGPDEFGVVLRVRLHPGDVLFAVDGSEDDWIWE